MLVPHNLHDPYYYQIAKSPTTLIDIEEIFKNLAFLIKFYFVFYFELMPLHFFGIHSQNFVIIWTELGHSP